MPQNLGRQNWGRRSVLVDLSCASINKYLPDSCLLTSNVTTCLFDGNMLLEKIWIFQTLAIIIGTNMNSCKHTAEVSIYNTS